MTDGELYCINYKNLLRKQEIIRQFNERRSGQEFQIPTDTSNCDHCDTNIWMMTMKVCFELRVTHPSYSMMEEGAETELDPQIH